MEICILIIVAQPLLYWHFLLGWAGAKWLVVILPTTVLPSYSAWSLILME